MMTSKGEDYECCMCGDKGLSHELFRCKVCRFRSQHRYCSNLYPKAESYSVCNWCLIQQNDNLSTGTGITEGSNNIPSKSCSPIEKPKTKDVSGSKAWARTNVLRPISPIKKPMMRSLDGRSPLSGRKGITAKDDRLRRTKSSVEMTNNYSPNSSSGNSGPTLIKHVIRNKVRRYKLLDEVSC
ncbi:hypothetical protein KSS87_022679 [Heliosperma pusillum]|nr:hypothetical protein KSS87_022679 [Heliosperma pusillum]